MGTDLTQAGSSAGIARTFLGDAQMRDQAT
jgi:hypothetical protein